jgi:predicted CXXCH cytochrome family protein
MKTIRFALMLTVAALAVIGLSPAYAFHSGGVAECTGCHSMHAPASAPLLAKGDPSSTCLNCHEHAGDTGPSSYHISSAVVDMPAGVPPKQRTPGGDFGWVKKTYTYSLRGTPTVDPGQSHGHNIVAVDFGYVADPDNTTAPGGTMSATDLACTSCHDPHSSTRRLNDGTIVTPTKAQGTSYAPIMGAGSYGLVPPAGLAAGVYRILGGSTYQAFTGTNFPGVPSAVTPSTYNRTEGTNQVRTAYGYSVTGGYTSWGQWCATCHGDMHTNNGYVHPVEQGLGATIAGNYNAYLKTGDLTGTTANSYNSLVPFAENTSDIATLAAHAKNDDTQLGGPTASDGVMCLSCHRAHASAWAFSLRWNGENEFLTMSDATGATSVYPGKDAVGNNAAGAALNAQTQIFKGYTVAEMQAAYYDRPATKFAPYQRQLCNKCHIQD